ncbi:hypothetical protein OIN60_21255 [Paenibacillus sp. P96]|uniref:Uncharacterized protein n=1 Tax=Paenibacillus zeirhizosphaerae TaxID=2987519 RepID=A0ABT9FX88_9BACL|nr:hypothetical protein [Paenibacillus sp. P96]MDP4099249.1 hypothetical protein [Paenibacillus sp. P96]
MNKELQIDQQRLVEAWQERLPTFIGPGDKAQISADEADPKALRIHIESEGRQMYSFDFICAYVDSREVKVSLVDVESGGRTIDERSDMIQQLADDYTRHIHQCAQALQQLTHA